MFNNKNFIAIFAHPDDEVIFASSVIEKASKIIICFSSSPNNKKVSIGRKIVKNDYPLKNIKFLGIKEFNRDSRYQEFFEWNNPKESEYGLLLKNQKINHEYIKNYYFLIKVLEPYVVNVDFILTHNPWGEYGHPEHVQLHRVVHHLAKKLNKDILVPGIFSEKSKNLMLKTSYRLNNKPFLMKTNKLLWEKLKTLYIKNNCWTWNINDQPIDYDCFYKLKDYDFKESNFKKYKSDIPLIFIDKPFILDKRLKPIIYLYYYASRLIKSLLKF